MSVVLINFFLFFIVVMDKLMFLGSNPCPALCLVLALALAESYVSHTPNMDTCVRRCVPLTPIS